MHMSLTLRTETRSALYINLDTFICFMNFDFSDRMVGLYGRIFCCQEFWSCKRFVILILTFFPWSFEERKVQLVRAKIANNRITARCFASTEVLHRYSLEPWNFGLAIYFLLTMSLSRQISQFVIGVIHQRKIFHLLTCTLFLTVRILSALRHCQITTSTDTHPVPALHLHCSITLEHYTGALHNILNP